MKKTKKKLYLQKKKRYLKKICGTFERPRLAVFRSHKHIYAQLIDDKNANTLAFSSTLDAEVIDALNKSEKKISTSTKEASFFVGQNLAKKAIGKKIEIVVFDRRNRPYHGRIQQVAEGARNQGLIF
jgi:large subunit ribosomal protein L18